MSLPKSSEGFSGGAYSQLCESQLTDQVISDSPDMRFRRYMAGIALTMMIPRPPEAISFDQFLCAALAPTIRTSSGALDRAVFLGTEGTAEDLAKDP